MQKNGWNLFQFRPFAQRLTALRQDVASLAQSDPTGYKQHPKTKLLASVYRSITVTVPINPADPVFRLGHTLGRQNGNWRRVKKGLPQRYRLFFMFASNPLQVIIYAWLNDEEGLRKEDSRTDVYEVFKRMLARGEVPSTIDELIQGSEVPILYGWPASMNEATGGAVAVAFNAGNLLDVATELRAKYPGEKIIVAGDDDHQTVGNPGLTKARAAALAVSG